MPQMRGLTIILTGSDPDRLYSALAIAATQAAAGGEARIFCEGLSTALLAEPVSAPADSERKNNGLPTLPEIREEATALGVRLIACQGGMALAGLSLDQLGDGVEAGGLIGVMTSLGDDRLVTL